VLVPVEEKTRKREGGSPKRGEENQRAGRKRGGKEACRVERKKRRKKQQRREEEGDVIRQPRKAWTKKKDPNLKGKGGTPGKGGSNHRKRTGVVGKRCCHGSKT